MGLIMTAQIIYSQTPSYVPTNGLVGYWPFNGNANDQSGNGNNGTVNGATLTTDRFGNQNSAYSFDGINDFISVNDDVSLKPTTGLTISAWVLIDQTQSGNFRRIVSKQYNDVQNFGSYQLISGTNNSTYQGTAGLTVRTGTGNSQIQPNIYSWTGDNGVSATNLYQHIVGTFDGSQLKFYQNGILVSTVNFSGNLFYDNQNLLFGKGKEGETLPGSDIFLNGKIDDIGIWNRALSQQEITNMYNGVTYSDTCNAVSGSLVNGLVGYWPFCGNANDDSGNGNNGTVSGATLTIDRFGNPNSAYNFDGVIGTHINVPLQQNLQGDKSFSCWLQLPETFINPYCNFITGKNLSIVLPNDYLSVNGNEVTYIANNTVGHFYDGKTGVGLFSSNDLNNNIWHHIVLTHNYISQEAKLYIDGVLIESVISNGLNTNSIIDRFIFGGDLNSNTSNNATLFGNLDDIGIWNRALTSQEVTQLFNQNQCITNITVTDTLIINVGQLSYTNPVTYANNITIYPNPANTQVNISFNNITDLAGGSIKIINSLGQQVATTPITLSGTNTTMALNSWGGTGLYFVQILNAQGQIVDIKKIILQ